LYSEARASRALRENAGCADEIPTRKQSHNGPITCRNSGRSHGSTKRGYGLRKVLDHLKEYITIEMMVIPTLQEARYYIKEASDMIG
jgi:hypothetical protein